MSIKIMNESEGLKVTIIRMVVFDKYRIFFFFFFFIRGAREKERLRRVQRIGGEI